MRRVALCLVWASIGGGCMEAPHHYGTVCDDVADCSARNPIPSNTTGSTGMPDGGHRDASSDGDASTTSVAVVGTLGLSNTIPVASGPGALSGQDGWLVTAVDDPTIPAVTTSDGGVFTFASVPLVGGAYRLSAAPPPGGGVLQAFMEASPTATTEHPVFVAISLTALQTVALGGGPTVDESSSHFVVQLYGTGTSLAGVSVDLRDETERSVASPIYDVDGATFSAAASATGSRGIAAFINVFGSVSGRALRVRLVRGTGTPVEYAATAYPSHVEWVPLPAP